MIKKCLACQEEIRGRSDKVFCDDTCRNYYHNERRKNKVPVLREIHKKLETNYRILKSLRDRGIREVHEEFLKGQGFDTEYVTQWSDNRAKRIVFDIALEQVAKSRFRLIQ